MSRPGVIGPIAVAAVGYAVGATAESKTSVRIELRAIAHAETSQRTVLLAFAHDQRFDAQAANLVTDNAHSREGRPGHILTERPRLTAVGNATGLG